MTATLTDDDAKDAARLLRACADKLPDGARGTATTLRIFAREYEIAAAGFAIANLDGLKVEIVPVGGLPAGTEFQVPSGISEILRVNDSGLQARSADGFVGWTNISSRTCPVAAVLR